MTQPSGVFGRLNVQPSTVRQTHGAGHRKSEKFRMGERRGGSKISRICWVDSDRPALNSQRQKNTEPSAQA